MNDKKIISQWDNIIITEDFIHWKSQLNDDEKNQIDNTPSDSLKIEILNAYFKDANDRHKNIVIDQEWHDFVTKVQRSIIDKECQYHHFILSENKKVVVCIMPNTLVGVSVGKHQYSKDSYIQSIELLNDFAYQDARNNIIDRLNNATD
jgi:hypothetical protein